MKQADCSFGAMYRRLRARLGPAQATVATAHAIARVVYRMLKYQVEYDPLSVNEYQKQYDEHQIKYIGNHPIKSYQREVEKSWQNRARRDPHEEIEVFRKPDCKHPERS